MEHPAMVIGVLGGMGTYATLNLFQQYTQVFPAVKEWDRPRIIIDNNCTMPSRVRAILYNEKRDELVDQMSASIEGLIRSGANRILLACNTSHLFLNDVYKRLPEAEELVVNILDVCAEELTKDGIKEAFVLATEGTLISGVYQQILEKANICYSAPNEEQFPLLRECIEAVKQNEYSSVVQETFHRLLSAEHEAYVLGCTELPVLFDRFPSFKETQKKVFDPLLLALKKIHRDYESSIE